MTMRKAVAAVALTVIMVGVVGPAQALADSRCDQHYSHTHGALWWERTDAFSSDGYGWNAWGLWDHWADHENSDPDWCDY